MSENNFNHFKVHTQYSICEGALKIDDYGHWEGAKEAVDKYF